MFSTEKLQILIKLIEFIERLLVKKILEFDHFKK